VARWAFGQPIAEYSRARFQEAASWLLPAAGPGAPQGFKDQYFEVFVHPFGTLIDVSNYHPDGLANSGPIGDAEAKH